RVDPTTGAQTVVSSGGNFVTPVGIAIAANGDILVADLNALGGPGGVIRVDPTTGAQTVVSSGGPFRNPPGRAVAPERLSARSVRRQEIGASDVLNVHEVPRLFPVPENGRCLTI